MVGDRLASFVRQTVGFVPCVGHLLHAFQDSTGVVFYLTDDAIVHLVERCRLVCAEHLFDCQHVLQQHGLVALGGRQHMVHYQIA